MYVSLQDVTLKGLLMQRWFSVKNGYLSKSDLSKTAPFFSFNTLPNWQAYTFWIELSYTGSVKRCLYAVSMKSGFLFVRQCLLWHSLQCFVCDISSAAPSAKKAVDRVSSWILPEGRPCSIPRNRWVDGIVPLVPARLYLSQHRAATTENHGELLFLLLAVPPFL